MCIPVVPHKRVETAEKCEALGVLEETVALLREEDPVRAALVGHELGCSRPRVIERLEAAHAAPEVLLVEEGPAREHLHLEEAASVEIAPVVLDIYPRELVKGGGEKVKLRVADRTGEGDDGCRFGNEVAEYLAFVYRVVLNEGLSERPHLSIKNQKHLKDGGWLASPLQPV